MRCFPLREEFSRVLNVWHVPRLVCAVPVQCPSLKTTHTMWTSRARRYIIGFLLSSFIPLTTGYTLFKCCPLDKQLDVNFKTCVDYSPRPGQETVADDNSTVTQPWWFPQDVQILDENAENPVNTTLSFLRGAFPLQVKYGEQSTCSFSNTQIVTSNIYDFEFLVDGTLVIDDPYDPRVTRSYPSLAYCVDRVNRPDVNLTSDPMADTHVIKLCPCLTGRCLRKCCPPRKLVHEATRSCYGNYNVSWVPNFENSATTLSNFSVLFGRPKCNVTQTLVSSLSAPYSVDDDGVILLVHDNKSVRLTYKDYCVDGTELDDGTQMKDLFYCKQSHVLEQKTHGLFYGVLVVVSAIFLLATLVVYTALPELRNLHGNNLMAHTASFLVAYIALAAAYIDPHTSENMCVAIGFIIQFSFLAAFFWLNVMCIDISWTFSGLRPPQGSARIRDHKKFKYYSIYAWGASGLISLVTAFMQFTPKIPAWFKPGLGTRHCFFNGCTPMMIYFYGPMALILIVNLGLFIYTAARILAVKRQTAVLHVPGSTAYNREKQRLILYVKLFLLMGITWVTEIISWAVGGPDYYWYLTDVLNLLRAVFIFIIFCCKRTVYNLFERRYNRRKSSVKPIVNRTHGLDTIDSKVIEPSQTPSMQMEHTDNDEKVFVIGNNAKF